MQEKEIEKMNMFDSTNSLLFEFSEAPGEATQVDSFVPEEVASLAIRPFARLLQMIGPLRDADDVLHLLFIWAKPTVFSYYVLAFFGMKRCKVGARTESHISCTCRSTNTGSPSRNSPTKYKLLQLSN